MAWLREVHGIVNGMFHSIAYKNIAALSYKCFRCLGSRMLLVTLFISMSIYLYPYWYCQELYIDMIDHCMKEPIISPITQKELQTSNSCIGYGSMWKILKDILMPLLTKRYLILTYTADKTRKLIFSQNG